jgi:uncharacterized membrane protein HdeD (DUF308 family)
MLRFCDKWWMTAGRGAVAVAFGLAVLFLPDLDHRSLALALGVFAFVDGLMLAALAVVARDVLDQWWLVLVESCVSFAVAAVALGWMTDSAFSLLALLAAWAVVTGVLEVEAGVRLRRLAAGEPSLLVAGGLSLVLGIVLVALSEAELARLTVTIGWFVVAYGGALGIVAFRLRRLAVAERSSRS